MVNCLSKQKKRKLFTGLNITGNPNILNSIDFIIHVCFVLFAGYGRFKNPDYRVFLALLEETKIDNSEENKVC